MILKAHHKLRDRTRCIAYKLKRSLSLPKGALIYLIPLIERVLKVIITN